MTLDLILKDIDDIYVRENFFRISKYIQNQTILDGQWKFYELEFLSPVSNFRYKHGLSFVPKDIIVLAIDGNRNIYFNYELFDSEFLSITCFGPCRIRFLIGAYRDKFRGVNGHDLENIPVGTTEASPLIGSSSRVIETFDTTLATSIGDLVKLTSANTVEKIANNTVGEIPNGIFGIGLSKPTSTTMRVLFLGRIDGYSGFTAASAVFVSATGTPTTTAPGAGMLQQIGFATSATEFYVNLMLATVI